MRLLRRLRAQWWGRTHPDWDAADPLAPGMVEPEPIGHPDPLMVEGDEDTLSAFEPAPWQRERFPDACDAWDQFAEHRDPDGFGEARRTMEGER